MVRTVQNILDTKGDEVWSVAPDVSVFEALEFMAEKNVGAVAVIDGKDLVGIMSERDYARKVILKSKLSNETPVLQIMTPEPICISPSDTVANCMQMMSDNRFRHLPVKDEGVLVGIISIGDVVRSVIEEQAFLIEQLESYITS